VNDHEPVSTEPLSSPPLVTAFEFENNSLNQENNYSTSSSSPKQKNNYSTSGFVSNNSLFNSLAKLTSLKSYPTLFSSVSLHSESEQHLNSNYVFPLSSLLSTNYTHSPTVDSPGSDHEFEELLLHFTYGSFSTPSSPTSSNPSIDSHTASERFTEFHKQPIHVFSSLSFYYSLKQPLANPTEEYLTPKSQPVSFRRVVSYNLYFPSTCSHCRSPIPHKRGQTDPIKKGLLVMCTQRKKSEAKS
jgi:hypothetical protein